MKIIYDKRCGIKTYPNKNNSRQFVDSRNKSLLRYQVMSTERKTLCAAFDNIYDARKYLENIIDTNKKGLTHYTGEFYLVEILSIVQAR